MVGKLPTLHDLLTMIRASRDMSCYRRIRVPGATYFFTVNLARRGSSLLIDHVDDLRRAYGAMMMEAPVQSEAMVVLPDHIHAIWTLPQGDHDYSDRWRRIKARFTRAIGQPAPRSASKQIKREAGIWQRRFWEHTIRGEEDFRQHLAYCWANPVKHGLVEVAADWPYSSIHRDIRLGLAAPDWRGAEMDGEFGE